VRKNRRDTIKDDIRRLEMHLKEKEIRLKVISARICIPFLCSLLGAGLSDWLKEVNDMRMLAN